MKQSRIEKEFIRQSTHCRRNGAIGQIAVLISVKQDGFTSATVSAEGSVGELLLKEENLQKVTGLVIKTLNDVARDLGRKVGN